MKINRNDPCPCGSGKKYKKCCLEHDQLAGSTDNRNDLFDDLHQLFAEQNFASLEDANSFLASHMAKRNQTARDDFNGLSPDQMHSFIYSPYASDDLVHFPEQLTSEPSAPILTLFNLLVAGIGEQGLKPTAKGNLPRNFCREAALSYWGEEGYAEETRYGNINKEEDFFELHVTRIIAELAGFIRKYKGKFILSRECRKLLNESGMKVIYPRLFRTYIKEYNWGYWDGYPEVDFIRHAFLFSLYLLHRYGDQWQPETFYAARFLKAFPEVLNEIPDPPYGTREETLSSCYCLRSVKKFFGFMGLAALEEIPTEKRYLQQTKVKKLTLADAVVTFHI